MPALLPYRSRETRTAPISMVRPGIEPRTLLSPSLHLGPSSTGPTQIQHPATRQHRRPHGTSTITASAWRPRRPHPQSHKCFLRRPVAIGPVLRGASAGRRGLQGVLPSPPSPTTHATLPLPPPTPLAATTHTHTRHLSCCHALAYTPAYL